MSARTVTPAISDRRHPHSRGTVDKLKHWLYADPPLSELREADEVTWPAWVKFWIARAIRYSWLRRDIAPGIYAFVILWAYTRSPVVVGPHPPRIPAVILVALCAGIGYWSLQHRDKASDDRRSHRIKRVIQRCCLDIGIRPVPSILWDEVKPHATLVGIDPIQGTDEKDLALKLVRRARSVLKAPVKYKQNEDGTGIVIVQHSDPLTGDLPLPAYLGNDAGAPIQPTWWRFPIGIDADGELLTVDLFQQHFLLPGGQRTGKSIVSAAAGIGMLAAPFVEPWATDPQDVSLACLRQHVPYAVSLEDALDLLTDFHTSMRKREIQMAEDGTSLATPSHRYPLRVLLIDEWLRFIDPEGHEIGDKYVEAFMGKSKDILRAGPKTGHVIWATCTDPRRKLLEGLAGLFTSRIIFRTADGTESGVAGANSPGFRAHELPKTPGRCIVKHASEFRQCRAWGVWDAKARLAASAVADSLLLGGEPLSQPTALPAASQPDPAFNGDVVVQIADRPIRRGRHSARAVILDYCLSHSPYTFEAISEATGIPTRTVSAWFNPEERTNPIRHVALGGGTYELVGR